ncbi:ogr/Delta-like zinc finger family protein [Escherichia coli]|uniref:ogr/Delta-like zinc finger family protein n=1 Tax=Escherichia coli TaxID=562 RepID=UPI000A19E37B
MAFPCPLCGAMSRTRTTEMLPGAVRETVYQCSNLVCGVAFYTQESFQHLSGRHRQRESKVPTSV